MPRKTPARGMKRKYEAAFKEEVLNSLRTTCGGNVGRAARLHDVPEQTLRDWWYIVTTLFLVENVITILDVFDPPPLLYP